MIPSQKPNGFTIVELLIVMAIMAILAVIAIPAYTGYIKEARLSTARANANSVRVFLEEYFLENSTYIVGGDTSYTKAELEANFGWRPDGDGNGYEYTVTAVDGGTPADRTWHITVVHDSSDDWIRCEDRMTTCCDVDTPGATQAACP